MSPAPEPTEAEHSELLAVRRAKLDQLRADGIDPFPPSFPGVVPTQSVRDAHPDLEAGAETDASYRVAGRLAQRRGQGKMAFLDLVDRSGRIQLQARVDHLGEERMKRLLDAVTKAPLAGVTIEIVPPVPPRSTVTGGDGSFRFDRLRPMGKTDDQIRCEFPRPQCCKPKGRLGQRHERDLRTDHGRRQDLVRRNSARRGST